MSKKVRLLFVSVLVIAIASAARQSILAQTPGEEYFADTGHFISGDFLEKYHSIPNPRDIYGYPITEAFIDPTTGRQVQYFEKARFELDTEAGFPRRVALTPLGEYLYEPGGVIPMADNSPACRTFNVNRFQVCYAFLEFYDANGGEAQFGLPISNAEQQHGRTVQYFQLARLEWHPGLPSGPRIVVADLGRQYFYLHGENPALLFPISQDDIISGIITLKARAFPAQAVTGAPGAQTVYVIVQDQRLLPVKDAQVALIVRLPSGKESRYIVPQLTNSRGITQYTFEVNAGGVGVATIEVLAQRNQLQTQTITSFRVWW